MDATFVSFTRHGVDKGDVFRVPGKPGRAYRLPESVTAEVADIHGCPYLVRLVVGFDSERPYCRGVTIAQVAGGPEVQALRMRSVPLASLVDEVGRRAVQQVQLKDDLSGWRAIREDADHDDVYRQWRSAGAPRQQLTDEFLRSVAEVVMHPETRHPTATVRDVLGGGKVHRNTARRWIKAARERFGERFERLEGEDS